MVSVGFLIQELFTAINADDVSEVESILQKSAVTVNAKRVIRWNSENFHPMPADGIYSALTAAIILRRARIVAVLVHHSADVHYRRNLSLEEVARLDMKKVSRSPSGRSARSCRDFTEFPVVIATAIPGNDAVVKILILNGADINTRDRRGNTLLMIAINTYTSTHNTDIICFLLANGADVNGWNFKSRCSMSADLDLRVLSILIDKGGNVNTMCSRGDDLVITFMLKGKSDCVLHLLQCGANKRAVDSRGFSLIMIATEQNLFDVVYFLLDSGVNINATQSHKGTLLDFVIFIAGQHPNYRNQIDVLRARGALESENTGNENHIALGSLNAFGNEFLNPRPSNGPMD